MTIDSLDVRMPLPPCATDMRDAFFVELNAIAAADRDVVLLTDDQGALALEWLRKNLPNQYFNAGIAEQNMVSVAAGMALAGKLPVLYGIATFMTMRAYEQIRDDLCAMGLPAVIVASGAGYMYSGDGPTHHAVQDVALMRTLPNMAILNPSDVASTIAFVKEGCSRRAGPTYVRIEKGVLGAIYPDGHDFSRGFSVLTSGEDVAIAATGIMVHMALEAAEKLTASGVRASVVDVYRLKPVDAQALMAELSRSRYIATLEEHSVIGGLGSIVSESAADYGRATSIKRLALPDKFAFSYGTREWLHAQDGLSSELVAKQIARWVTGK